MNVPRARAAARLAVDSMASGLMPAKCSEEKLSYPDVSTKNEPRGFSLDSSSLRAEAALPAAWNLRKKAFAFDSLGPFAIAYGVAFFWKSLCVLYWTRLWLPPRCSEIVVGVASNSVEVLFIENIICLFPSVWASAGARLLNSAVKYCCLRLAAFAVPSSDTCLTRLRRTCPRLRSAAVFSTTPDCFLEVNVDRALCVLVRVRFYFFCFAF